VELGQREVLQKQGRIRQFRQRQRSSQATGAGPDTKSFFQPAEGDESVHKLTIFNIKKEIGVHIPGSLTIRSRVLRAISSLRHFATCLLFLVTIWPVGRALAAEEAAQLTPAEQFVLKKVAAGEVADFSDPPWKQGQELRAFFLEKLLSGQFKNVHWRGVRINYATIAQPLNLNWADVPYNVSLENCQFHNAVHFRFTRFAKGLGLYSSIFRDLAEFAHTNVAGELDLRQARFEYEGEVAFDEMEVAHNAHFDGAVFNGTANFTNAKIGEEFLAAGAKFLSKGEKSSSGNAMETRGAIFNVMKVGTVADFSDAIFSGPADFRVFEAGVALDLSGAKFNEQKEKSYFQFLRAGVVLATGTFFEGDVDFQEARVSALQIKKTQIKGSDVTFGGMHVERLQALDLQMPNIQGQKGSLDLTGATYQQLSDPDQLFQLIKGANFSRQNYATLEAYLKAHGDAKRADDVFVEMKRRERGTSGLMTRPWGWLLDGLVRYGRSPERAFYGALAFVLVGTAVYWRRRDVQARRTEDENKPYNPFWYSLDLLVPAINLQVADTWIPKQDSLFRRNYGRVHRILGWVLIPIGLAAVSGLIK
jgi:uncharacterized protein YjbI with pentapeptide repeats